MSGSSGASTELQDAFKALSNFVWRLHYDWITFLTLYSNTQTVTVLNETAPAFFAMEQGRLVDDLKLGIARLFDPAFTGGNRSNTNLTFPAIVDLLSGHPNTQFVQTIDSRVTSLKTRLAPIINERHNRLAHLDRATALGGNVLGNFSRDEFGSALTELEAVLNDVDKELHQNITYFGSISVQAAAHATILVRRLKAAATMNDQEWMERLAAYDESHSNP